MGTFKLIKFLIVTVFFALKVDAACQTFITIAENLTFNICKTSSYYFTVAASVPFHYWLAISFGGSHYNSEMLIFKSFGLDQNGNEVHPSYFL